MKGSCLCSTLRSTEWVQILNVASSCSSPHDGPFCIGHQRCPELELIASFIVLSHARAGLQGYNATWIRNIAEGVPVQITMPQECSAIPSCSVAPVPICPYVQGCNGGGSKQQAVSLQTLQPCPDLDSCRAKHRNCHCLSYGQVVGQTLPVCLYAGSESQGFHAGLQLLILLDFA